MSCYHDNCNINCNIVLWYWKCSLICAQLANKLYIVLSTTTQVALSSFGSHSSSFQTLGVAIPSMQIQIFTEDLVPISVLIVPKIATPIQNSCPVELDNLPHLKGLQLANPVTDSEEFLVSILIRVDYYWSFLQDHIVRGDGPMAQQSWLGWTPTITNYPIIDICPASAYYSWQLRDQSPTTMVIGTDSHEPSSVLSVSQLPNGT